MMYKDLSGVWDAFLDEEKRDVLPDLFDCEITLPDSTSHAKLGKKNDQEERYRCLTDLYQFEGYAWFRRRISLTNDQAAGHLMLILERTRKTTVYVDGNKIGEFCSLCTPHRYKLDGLTEGEHELVIRVDNTDYPTRGGHLTSPDTQSNWNGITGKIGLLSFHAYPETVSVAPEFRERPVSRAGEMLVPEVDTADVDTVYGMALQKEVASRSMGLQYEEEIDEIPNQKKGIACDMQHQKKEAFCGMAFQNEALLCGASVQKKATSCMNMKYGEDMEGLIHVSAVIAGEPEGVVQLRVFDENGEYGSCAAEFSGGVLRGCDLVLSGNYPLWSEFSPAVLKLELKIGDDIRVVPFGMRSFTADGRRLRINGAETFLRGKHEGLSFPETGFAPTDAASWRHIFAVTKEYGINHYRFHTCCPPEAAFEAADQEGIYLQPELPFWGTVPEEWEGEQWFLKEEGYRMLREFGHHPSFVMMSLGNELWGSRERLEELLAAYHEEAPDKLLVQGSNNFQFTPCILEHDQFFSGVRFGRDRLIRGSYASCDAPFGHVQTEEPNSVHNYDDAIDPYAAEAGNEEFRALDEKADGEEFCVPDEGADSEGLCALEEKADSKIFDGPDAESGKISEAETGEILIQYGTGMKKVKAEHTDELVPEIPVISHEVGQYCMYPDYDEIAKYNGALRHDTYEGYRERARERGLLPYWHAFFEASGALSVACYRDDIETALRSSQMAGFQLLDLQDFPGQGIATVGILNAFRESKGLIKPEEWRRFCGARVVLAELERFVYTSGERISAGLLISSTEPGEAPSEILWSVKIGGVTAVKGVSAVIREEGRLFRAQAAEFSLDCDRPVEAVLELAADDGKTTNCYTLYVYPELAVTITEEEIVYEGKRLPIVHDLDFADETNLCIPLLGEECLQGEYCTDFWCYGMFKSISEQMGKPVPTGTMGLLVNPESPLLGSFPCHSHTTPPWHAIVTHSRCANLDGTAIVPDVWVIDNPLRASRLALLYRDGKKTVCTSRLWEIVDRAEVRWFAVSLLDGIQKPGGSR